MPFNPYVFLFLLITCLDKTRTGLVSLVCGNVLNHPLIILVTEAAFHGFKVTAVFGRIKIDELSVRLTLRNPFVPPCQNDYLRSVLKRLLPLIVESNAVLS